MIPKLWVSAGEVLASALIQTTLEPRQTSENCSPNTPSADSGRWARVLQSTRVHKGKWGPQQECIDRVFQFSLQGGAKGSGDTTIEKACMGQTGACMHCCCSQRQGELYLKKCFVFFSLPGSSFWIKICQTSQICGSIPMNQLFLTVSNDIDFAWLLLNSDSSKMFSHAMLFPISSWTMLLNYCGLE